MPTVDQTSFVPKLTAERELALIEAIEQIGAIKLTYLFGSQAKHQAGPLSDIDIGILIDPALCDSERHSVWKQAFVALVKALHTDEIDLVDLSCAPPALIRSIVDNGRLVLDRDPVLRVGFVRDSIINYLDTKPLREELSRGLTRRLEDGSFGRR